MLINRILHNLKNASARDGENGTKRYSVHVELFYFSNGCAIKLRARDKAGKQISRANEYVRLAGRADISAPRPGVVVYNNFFAAPNQWHDSAIYVTHTIDIRTL